MKDKFFYQKVAEGKIEVDKIYESSSVIAFHHPFPQYEKHIIILPKVHIKDFSLLKAEHETAIWDIIKVAKYISKGLSGAGQTVRFLTDIGDLQDGDYLHFQLVSGEKLEKLTEQ